MAHLSKKDQDDDYGATAFPFHNIDKGLVLQERRLFSQTQPDPAKCCVLITKVLYLLTQGVRLTKTEATDFFFATTKLFQSEDLVLRRLVYLVLKELSPYASDMIMMISSLTKDINCDNHIYKSNAIRVLCCCLSDISLLGQGERYLRQAIVDKEPTVGSAALVSGVHLMNASPAGADIVKRWVGEIGEACRGKDKMVQYHSLGLHYQIKAHDRLAVSKLVLSMVRLVVRSPHARCLLIRFSGPLLREFSSDESVAAPLWEFLSSSLRHKSDMVTYEAARLICQLEFAPERILSAAISVLQMFLSVSKPVLKFAAVRTLNQVAMRMPAAVQVCNSEMEQLIGDPNRNVATLAITTVLKTSTAETVERLVRQLASFMDDISDEFKIVVVNAICALAIKFPHKHRTLMAFLSEALRDEGGIEFKQAIVNAILSIIEVVPAAKEVGLAQLCEFIEDCEFSSLSTRILTVIGREGPTSKSPSKLIRYVYNRVILENAVVRAAAVSALGKFAVAQPSLRPSIAVLLRRCLFDSDDEVRDRATYALQLFSTTEPASSSSSSSHLSSAASAASPASSALAAAISPSLPFSLASLEQALLDYRTTGSATAFDPSAIPREVDSSALSGQSRAKLEASTSPLSASALSSNASSAASPSSSLPLYQEQLASVPELAVLNLGALLNSSSPSQLTESETEYVVNCVKHVFRQHFVFQFNITNTLQDQVLNRALVEMEVASDDPVTPNAIHFVTAVRSTQIPYKGSSAAFVVFRKDLADQGEEANVDLLTIATFSCVMKFQVHEYSSKGIDEEDFEEDEYELEDVELATVDFVAKRHTTRFNDEWNSFGDDSQSTETLNLSTAKSLADAVAQITALLGMQPVDDSEKVPSSAAKHVLYLGGNFLSLQPFLARVRMRKSSGPGVDLELSVRCTNPDLSEAICQAIVGA